MRVNINIEPTIEELSKARQQGYDCAQAGINTAANTYRNKGHASLFVAWLEGYNNYNPAVDPEQEW